MHFTKMHGLGNDYLYVYGQVPADIRDLSVRLSDRHRGAGADGMIYISPSGIADFKMRIFNADGSEARMCGNGIRCVGKYVYDKGYTDKTALTIETLSGIRTLRLHVSGGSVKSVTVGMGLAEVGADLELDLEGERLCCTPVSVGNPHAVIFTGLPDSCDLDLSAFDIAKIGPLFENHVRFPQRTNTEFVRVVNRTTLRMRVWERGNGETLACGTGACAAAVAAVENGYCQKGADITVKQPGGDLIVNYTDNMVTLTGNAVLVFEGSLEF